MKIFNRILATIVLLLVLLCLAGVFITSNAAISCNKNLLNIQNFGLKEFAHSFLILLVTVVLLFIWKFFFNKISLNHQQYFNLFENNPTPIAIVDNKTLKFLAANKAAIACYGYTSLEFLSLKASDIIIPDKDVVKSSQIPALKVFTSQKEMIRKHRKKNGEIILTKVLSSKVVFKNKKCTILLAHDITEIVRSKEEKRIAEEESLTQKKFTAYVLENFPVDVAIFDKDHRYIFINKVAVRNEEMRKWMIGKNDFEYFEKKGLDDTLAKQRREGFTKAIGGESSEWVDEHVVNGETKYVLRKFYPYMEEGNLKYVYGYGMDITEIKKAQFQKDEYFKQLEKIAFATSHKIRQPICNIQGLISILEDENFDKVDLKKTIAFMRCSSTELDDLTRELAIKLHKYKTRLSVNGDT